MSGEDQPSTAAHQGKKSPHINWGQVITILGVVITILSVVVSIAFYLNYERHSRADAIDKLHDEVTQALVRADDLLGEINYEIISQYILSTARRDEGFRKLHDARIAIWKAEKPRLEQRIGGYTTLKSELEDESIAWATLKKKKSEFKNDAYADARLGTQFDRERKYLQEQLSARSRQSALPKDSPAIDGEYIQARKRSFHKEGDRWVEYPEYAPGRHFTFQEKSRDDQYIYLQDPSRPKDGNPRYPMLVRLPIRGGAAQWTYEESSWADMFVIDQIDQ